MHITHTEFGAHALGSDRFHPTLPLTMGSVWKRSEPRQVFTDRFYLPSVFTAFLNAVFAPNSGRISMKLARGECTCRANFLEN